MLVREQRCPLLQSRPCPDDYDVIILERLDSHVFGGKNIHVHAALSLQTRVGTVVFLQHEVEAVFLKYNSPACPGRETRQREGPGSLLVLGCVSSQIRCLS